LFKKLRDTLKKFVESVATQITTRQVSESELEPILEELTIDLVESDVAYDAARALTDILKRRLVGTRVPRFSDTRSIVVNELIKALEELLSRNWKPLDVFEEAKHHTPHSPMVLTFFGVNGVGKTTTIAKFAYRFKRMGVTPVIVASDTFRAGAQEQLRKHAEKLNVPFIGGRYGADPAAVAYDALEYARSRGYRVVLVDTAGRMHTDVDLMEELRKIVRVVKPKYKVLIVDALTGNDALEQASFFEEAVGVDFIVLTKVDADVKGGTAVSVAYSISKPILYVGTGQRYEDLEVFDPKRFARKIVEGLV
jgi:fused signal recognition particle receptor